MENIINTIILLENVVLFALLILIGHGVIQAVWFLFSNEGLFQDFSKALMTKTEEGYTHRWATKPIYSCPNCMSSVWGITVFFYTQYIGIHAFPIEYLPVYLLSLLGWVSLYEERNQ